MGRIQPVWSKKFKPNISAPYHRSDPNANTGSTVICFLARLMLTIQNERENHILCGQVARYSGIDHDWVRVRFFHSAAVYGHDHPGPVVRG